MTAGPAAVPPEAGRGGSIYDLGYRGYEGPRLGRPAAIGALLVHSVRTAYGIGRSTRSKIVPIGLAVFASLPSLIALGVIALLTQFGDLGDAVEFAQPIRYASLFPIIAVVVFLFCASQAPELFGRDQMAGVLPLYFSRATSRLDYAAARLLGLLLALLVLVLLPQLILLAGRVLIAVDPLDGLALELPSMPAAITVGLIVAGVVGSVSSAIAALTPRRSYATVAIIAVFLIPNIGAALLVALETGLVGQIAVLLSPADVLDGLNAFLFVTRPDNPTVADADLPGPAFLGAAAVWIVGSVAILARRYQRLVV